MSALKAAIPGRTRTAERARVPVLEESLARTKRVGWRWRWRWLRFAAPLGSMVLMGVVALLSAACAAATDDPVVVTLTVTAGAGFGHRRRSFRRRLHVDRNLVAGTGGAGRRVVSLMTGRSTSRRGGPCLRSERRRR